MSNARRVLGANRRFGGFIMVPRPGGEAVAGPGDGVVTPFKTGRDRVTRFGAC